MVEEEAKRTYLATREDVERMVKRHGWLLVTNWGNRCFYLTGEGRKIEIQYSDKIAEEDRVIDASLVDSRPVALR